MSIIKRKKSVIVDTHQKTTQRAGYLFILVFIFLATVIITAGYLSYRSYREHYCAEMKRNLSAVAKLKVDELVDWRKERFGDASIFFKNNSFTDMVRRFSGNPKDADAQRELQAWMGKVQTNHQYDQVRLLDVQGVTRISVPTDLPPVSSAILQRLPEVLRSGQVTLQDFYRSRHDQRICLSVMVPIVDEKNGSRALGVLSLRINPEIYLYPFIQKWPTDSRTAETLLVRREGNDVLFLNEIRFQKNTALSLWLSLEKKEIIAVKAVLGQEGIVEGKDYRGVPVVAVVHAVPDSPWFLVTRMDTSEVYTPMRERLWMMGWLVIVMLLGLAAFLGFLWRQQNIRDITERKKAEDERKNLLEQLVRSEKLAAVGELISGVAHEINNPLTEILGLSGLLLREKKENIDEDTRKDLEFIYKSSERIKKIVANLLRFARRETPVRKDVNVNELLDAVLEIRNYEIQTRNIDIKKHYQPDLPLIMADPSQLEQVFLNLITNAEYAIHETGKAGTLTIATSLQEEQPEHKKVIIEFSDTGAGIPEGVITKIFDPFFTTKPVGKGTGLGLSVSYGIIKEHGGEINVHNRAEGGAVFTVELLVQGGEG